VGQGPYRFKIACSPPRTRSVSVQNGPPNRAGEGRYASLFLTCYTGVYGPAKGERRTILPWFCGLQNDLETLEVVESGTWSDLSVAHRDMVAARLSPSGLANRYGAIPFAFPAAMIAMR
jgi:hypothetical protein